MNLKKLPKPYDLERKLFYAALSALVLMASAYMYFVSASVVHVVMRKEIGKEIATMHTTISQLEAAYIESQHTMSESLANQKGFVKASDKIFIDATSPTLVLSRN